MSDTMNSKSYTEMINALYHFATKVDQLTTQLTTNVNICRNILGEDDQSAGPICDSMKDIYRDQLSHAKKALQIAKAMQDERDMPKKESAIWNE